jgi:hypothetical protein
MFRVTRSTPSFSLLRLFEIMQLKEVKVVDSQIYIERIEIDMPQTMEEQLTIYPTLVVKKEEILNNTIIDIE